MVHVLLKETVKPGVTGKRKTWLRSRPAASPAADVKSSASCSSYWLFKRIPQHVGCEDEKEMGKEGSLEDTAKCTARLDGMRLLYMWSTADPYVVMLCGTIASTVTWRWQKAKYSSNLPMAFSPQQSTLPFPEQMWLLTTLPPTSILFPPSAPGTERGQQ